MTCQFRRSFTPRVRWSCTLLASITTGVIVASGTAPSRASESVYYVSPFGHDSNPGTVTQPFATIQRAANIVNAGDTVIVEDGAYKSIGTGTPCASSGNRPVVCIARGGTDTAWVTFRSKSQWGAKIDGAANASTYGFQLLGNVGFIRIEGFDVFGMGSPTHDVAGFVVYDGAHDVVIAQNDIHDIGRLCTDHVYGMSGIYVQTARVTIDSNRFHDIGRFEPGENGCRPATANYRNHDHGIYISGRKDAWAPGARDVLVSNNLFWNLARGWPIQVYPGAVENLSILHNTFTFANPYRIGQIIVAASTTNARVNNNLFFEPLTAAINFSSGTHTNFAVANNLTSRAIANNAPAGVTFARNREFTDPQLVPWDMSLQSTSPAIDTGMALPEVRRDIAGVLRPQATSWDVGAWESVPPAAGVTIEMTSPQNGDTVDRRVAVSANASSTSGVVNVQFYVDGVRFATDQLAPYTTTLRPSRYTIGPHVLSVTATDAAGRTATAAVTITIAR